MTNDAVETRPTWQVYQDHVRNEELTAALTLLGVDPYGVVRADAVLNCRDPRSSR